MVEIMRILAARTGPPGPPPSDGGIIDGRDEDYRDIDRWENDGGKSSGARLSRYW
jgi:hypothetical protein